MPSSDPAQRFQDILDNIARIERFAGSLTAEAFCEDEKVVYAVKHALLIISEAAIKLGALAAEMEPKVPWAEIRGIGSRLRHEYDTVDPIRIWRVVERDMPEFKLAVTKCLERLRTK